MDKPRTTRVNLFRKCGSCVHAHYDSPRYPCAIKCDLRMNPRSSLFQRTRSTCHMYEFDANKLCKCGETKEVWYNYCPKCGAKMGGAENNA